MTNSNIEDPHCQLQQIQNTLTSTPNLLRLYSNIQYSIRYFELKEEGKEELIDRSADEGKLEKEVESRLSTPLSLFWIFLIQFCRNDTSFVFLEFQSFSQDQTFEKERSVRISLEFYVLSSLPSYHIVPCGAISMCHIISIKEQQQ